MSPPVSKTLSGWVSRRQRKRDKNKRQRFQQRRSLLERLEARVVLNGQPITVADPFYDTAQNTSLTVSTSDTTLLDNDWDPESSSLTASIVANPANGTVTNFSSTAGTFTYTPDNGFSGVDTFTYKVSDGTDDSDDSETVGLSIAVGGDFGPRTNQEERTRESELLAGGNAHSQELTPGLFLHYQSNTLPQPIIVAETTLLDSSSVPDEIRAKLTFNSSAGADYAYNPAGLSAGDTLRFALQHDATSLSTGRYDYSVLLTADYTSSTTTRTFTGSYDVVNRSAATHPFGVGWQLEGLDKLVSGTGGMLWVKATTPRPIS